MGQSIKNISIAIKARRKYLLSNSKQTRRSFFLFGIALVAILNFSVPLMNVGFNSCDSVIVNLVDLLQGFIVDFSGESYPEQYVQN